MVLIKFFEKFRPKNVSVGWFMVLFCKLKIFNEYSPETAILVPITEQALLWMKNDELPLFLVSQKKKK